MRIKIHPASAMAFGAAIGILALSFSLPLSMAQLTGILSQGLTMTMTSNAGGQTSTTTHYFSGNASKSVSSTGMDSIIRFDQQKLISIDNKNKTYSEMSFSEMQAMMDRMVAEMSADPETMAAMKKMMGGSSAPLSVTRQGQGNTIAGYATEKYLVTGPMDMEIWAAPDLKVPASYFDSMKLRIPANPIFDMRKMFDAFKQINGWPIKYVMTMKMMGRTMTTTTEATSIQKGAIPASTFEVPAGYKPTQEKF